MLNWQICNEPNRSHVICSTNLAGDIYELAIANCLSLKLDSFKFVRQQYAQNNLGLDKQDSLWFSLSELLHKTYTVLLLKNKSIVGSVTITGDSFIKLACDSVFPQDISRMRENGERLAEIYSFAMANRVPREFMGKMFNILTLLSKYVLKASHWLITVVPKHDKFYHRFMLFEKMGKGGFHEKTGVDCVLLKHQVSIYRKYDSELHPKAFFNYYFPPDEEQAVMKRLKKVAKGITAEEFIYFINLKPHLWAALESSKKNYLINTFGEELKCLN